MDEAQVHKILHGVKLETILTCLYKKHGWEGLYERIPINCFSKNPSIKSSLTFLRKTPWAREKVINLYIYLKPEDRAVPTASEGVVPE
jgi:uncharacterized protein (DUF2132 family)